MKFFSIILSQINSGSARTVVVKKNILGSFVIKGFSVATSLLLIPVTLTMLNSEKYGIWITLYSIVHWFNMMDIGLGNGFRNKFAEAVALGENERARKYIETIYGSTFIIAIFLFSVYTIAHPFLNWYKILNITGPFDENISIIVWIVFGLFSIQLVLKNIKTILLALQKTALSNAIGFIGNLITLVAIIILGKYHLANLRTISMVFMLSPIIVSAIATFVLFEKKLKNFIPHNLKIKREFFGSMINLGIKFFFIQVTTIVMFTSANFIITQLFGPKEVTPYDITYRLFASTISIFSIIITPFWSAFTEAITKHDFSWIKRALKKLKTIWMFFTLGILGLLFLSPIIFHYWIGDKVKISFILSVMFALYVALLSWTGMFAQFLNGVGKIKVQLYIAIFQCISNIPLAIILAKYLNLGISGVILATNINLMLSAIILPIQVRKISNQNAHGSWNK